VGLPSGEYIEIPFKLFDLMHANGVLYYSEKYQSFIFDDKDYENIKYYLNNYTSDEEKFMNKKERIVNFLENVGVVRYKINNDYTIDTWQDVKILEKYNKLPVTFDCVIGNFEVSCELITLNGCPDTISGDFICNKNRLKNLKGGPRVVYGKYDVSNNGLYSLEGSPIKIFKDFVCSYNNLSDLNGGPTIVEGSFISDNGILVSLEGSPEIVGKNFDVSYNLLDTLYGTTAIINGTYDCSNNDLKTLKFGPKSVGIFKCNGNRLKNLDDAPDCKKIISDKI
jgi:hypothetical protein